MYEWQSIPSDEHSSFLARYFFNHHFHVGRVIFLALVVLMGIGLISSPHGHAHADTNVNMSSDQFNAGYQNAQNHNWFTGNWGTARFYIAGSDMYVSGGQLQGRLKDIVGISEAHQLNSINFTSSAQTPQDSSWLLAADYGNDNYNVSLHYLNGLSNLDTSQTNNMSNMFYNDTSITHLDGIQNWDMSHVNDTSFMFKNDNHLQDLNLSNWNVGQVTNMYSMFSGLASLSSLGDISHWDTHSAQNMTYMFDNDIALTRLDLDHWNTHNVNKMYNMFADTNGLTDLNVKDWDVSQVTDMSDMFHNFNGSGLMTNLDLSGWHTDSLQNGTNMFINQSALRNLDLSNFDTTHADMGWSFLQDPGLLNITLGNNTKLGNVQYLPGFGWQNDNQVLGHDQLSDGNSHPGHWQRNDFADQYYDASQRGYWGTAPWYIDNNRNMHIGAGQLLGSLHNTVGSMNVHSINSLNFDGKVQAPQDSSWLLAASSGFGDNDYNLQAINGTQNIDTSQVKYMGDMFSNDMNLKSLDLSNWDTSHVVDMNSIFDADASLSDLNVADWDVSNVQNFAYGFYLTSLSHLDLSGWNTASANNMIAMFNNNSSLRRLDLNNLDTRNANVNNMFFYSPNIHQMTLGDNARFKGIDYLPGFEWQQGNQKVKWYQLYEGDSHPGTWTRTQFDNDYGTKERTSGMWGSALWYIDNNNDMYISGGQLKGSLGSVIGSDNLHSINSINFTDSVQAPQDSSNLLSTNNGPVYSTSNLTNIDGLDKLDTSQVTNMQDMFYSDTGLSKLDLSDWNTSNVSNMLGMFTNNASLKEANLSGWRTDQVNNMYTMFANDTALTNLNMDTFNTQNANTSNMFGGSWTAPDSSLASVSLGSDTRLYSSEGLPNVIWQNGATHLNSQQLTNGSSHPGNWQLSSFYQNIKNEKNQGVWGTAPWYIDSNNNMHVGSGQLDGHLYNTIGSSNASRIQSISFDEPIQAPQNSNFLLSTSNDGTLGETHLKNIYGLDKMDTSQVTSMNNIFSNDAALTDLDLSSWNTDNLKDMSFAFWNNASLSNLNLSSWDTTNTDNMHDTFDVTNNLYNLTLGDKTYIKDGNQSGFSGSKDKAASFAVNGQTLTPRQLEDGNSHSGDWQPSPFFIAYQNAQKNGEQTGLWGTAPYYIDNNGQMQIGAGQLNGRLGSTVSNTDAIQSIKFDDQVQAPQDSSALFQTNTDNQSITALYNLNNLDTSQVTNMNSMFFNDNNISTFQGIDQWDTSRVTDMGDMFNLNYMNGQSALTNLDLSGWNTSSVTDMSDMFDDNSNLQSLNISSFDTSKVTDMNGFFGNSHDFMDTNLNDLSLGDHTYLKQLNYIPRIEWQNGSQILSTSQLNDGNSHPGHWTPTQFSLAYQNAQNQGQTTGFWGTAPYYIDNDMSMHVGSGQLNEPIYDVLGDNVHNIKTINLDENVRAPDNSLALFSGRNYHLGSDVDSNQSITAINGLDKLNVSNVYNFHDMFYRDVNLNTPMNLNNWDTSNVNDMGGMFGNTNIPSFDINNWNVSNNTTTAWMFYNDTSLHDLNLDNWHTSNLGYSQNTFSGDMNLKSLNLQNFKNGNLANYIFFGTDGQTYNGPTHNLEQLTLGDNTRINNQGFYFPGATWTNGKDLLSRYEMDDGNPHPGTWHLTPFAQNYRYAKQHGWQYGNWGNAPWYIDPNMNMHIGKGRLQGSLNSIVPNMRHQLQSINIDEPVQAPQNSAALFASTQGFMDNDYTLKTVNGLNLLDTSQVTNMNSMFYNDTAVNHLDVSNWDTSKVQDFSTMFTSNNALTDLRGVQNWNVQSGQSFDWMFYGAPWSDLDLSNWQTPNAKDMTAMFEAAGNLHNLNISNFDTTHAKVDNMFGNDTRYNLPSDAISNLSLGNKTVLQNNAGLSGGIWSSDNSFLDTFQLMDGNSHPGSWRYYPVQNINDLSGTTDDKLRDLIGSALHLSNDDKQFQIINDQGSQDSQGDLKEGNYSDLTFVHIDANGNPTFYRTNLSVHPYVKGPDLQASVGQTTNFVLYNAVQNATGDGYNPSYLDDDGGSTNNGNHLQYGDYTIKYRYQDNSNNWQYVQSNLHVGQDSFANYLYVNDNGGTTPNDSDYMSQVGQFLGINPAVVHLNDGDGFPGEKGYTAQDNNQSFYGRIVTVPKMVRDLTMDHIPGASDAAWDHIIEDQFPNDADFGFNVTDNHIYSFQRDDKTGAVEVQGTVHPDNTRDNTNFANSPVIPYDFHVHPSTSDYSIDNTVNDKQVQDVINTVSDNSRVVKVTDGQGSDVTGAFGGLSSIPYNSNVTVTVDTGHGYANVHFAHINVLVEPNVDITHNSVMDGSDINDNDLQGDIMGQTHENTMNGFSIDNSQMVSPNVKEVDYHFTKDTVATGSSLDVKTSNNQVNGTAYIHYTNDDTSSTPTFTVTQGSNPVQHIENVTGHTVQITQAPEGKDINNLPVGSYDVAYQYTDMNDSELNANFFANITVIPNYYFSPVTNDSHFNNADSEAGYFKSYDYQNQGNSYKSVVDTQDHSKDNDTNHGQNGSSNSSSSDMDTTVDGLHTQDGKPAHFNSSNPYK